MFTQENLKRFVVPFVATLAALALHQTVIAPYLAKKKTPAPAIKA